MSLWNVCKPENDGYRSLLLARRSALPQPLVGVHSGPGGHLHCSPPGAALPPSSSSPSPDARPFLPSGRSKSQRWEDSTLPESSGEGSPPARASFRDVLLSRPAPSQQAPKPTSLVAASPPPRPPLRSTVGFCSLCPSQASEDGWRMAARRIPHRGVPPDLRGKCFNCFSLHRTADCRRRTRCFRCLEPGHRSYGCPRRLVASRPHNPPPSPATRRPIWRPVPVPQAAAPMAAGSSAAGHHEAPRRPRRRRRRSKVREPTASPPASGSETSADSAGEESLSPGTGGGSSRPPPPPPLYHRPHGCRRPGRG
jgi:hypothetical protein